MARGRVPSGQMLGEFGEGSDREEHGEGIADATRITVIGEGEEAGIEGERTKEEGNRRQGDGESGGGRLHRKPFLCVVMIQHHNHTK